MKVIPAAGRSVRDPRTMTLLAPEGREVEDGDPFWVRRLRDGDVTIAEDPPEPPPVNEVDPPEEDRADEPDPEEKAADYDPSTEQKPAEETA